MKEGGRASAESLRRLLRPVDFTGRGADAGLEITSRAVRGVLLRRSGSGVSLVAAVEVERGAGVRGEAALREASRELGLARRHVVLAFSGCDVDADLVPLEDVPRGEIGDAVRWKFRKRQGAPPSREPVVAFRVERPGLSSGRGAASTVFLAAAADEDRVRERCSLLERASIRSYRFAPDVAALEALLRRSRELESDEPVALAHVGDDSSSLLLFSRRGFESRKEIRLGVADFERALCEPISLMDGVVHLDPEQARAVLRSLDLSREADVPVPGRAPIPSSALRALVRPLLERLEGDVLKSLRLVERAGEIPPCGRLLLTGPGAEIPGIAGVLAERLGMDVRFLDPLEGIEVGAAPEDARRIRRSAQRLALAIGAALDREGSLELLPPDVWRGRVLQLVRFAARRFAFFAAALLAAIGAVEAMNGQRLQAQLRLARGRVDALVPAVAAVQASERLDSRVARSERVLRTASPHEVSAAGALADAARALPPSCYLQELRLMLDEEVPRLVLRGTIAPTDSESPEEAIRAIYEGLGTSPFFRDAEVSASLRPGDGPNGAHELTVSATLRRLPRRL